VIDPVQYSLLYCVINTVYWLSDSSMLLHTQGHSSYVENLCGRTQVVSDGHFN